jgi:hypothetical protein
VKHLAGETGYAATLLGLCEGHGNMGSWTWTPADDLMRWSSGFFRILGLDPVSAEPSWSLLESVMHGEDALPAGAGRRIAAQGELQDLRFRILRPDGDVRWVRLVSGVTPVPNRAPATIVGVIFDVTASQRCAEAQQRLDGLIEDVSELYDLSIWRTEADGSVGDPMAWWQMTGQMLPAADRWAHLATVHPDDRQTVLDAWASSIRTGVHRCEVRVMVGGEYVKGRSRAAPIRDGSGRITGWLGTTAFEQPAPAKERPRAQARETLLSAAQVRAARGLLDWTARDLADRSGLSFSTVRRIETPGPRAVRKETLLAARSAFEKHGVEFVTLGDGRDGLVLKP